MGTQTLLQLIGGFVRRHWRAYVASALMLVGVAVLTVWVPRQVGRIVDALVAGELSGMAMARELAVLVAMGVAIYLLRVGWRLQLFAAAYRLGVELRTRLYAKLTTQGPQFFHRSRTGDLMARATNDVDAVELAAGEAFLAGFDGTLTLVLVVAMMTLGVDWRLALVALLPFPFMAWSFWVISQRVHDAWRESLDRFSKLNDHVQETVAGVRTLRALGLEARAGAEFAQRTKAAADSSFEALRWEAAYEPAVGGTLTLATVLTFGFGGWFVWQQQMTLGQLTAFTMYLGQLIWPMFAMGWVLSLIERGRAAWARLDPVLREPPGIDDCGSLEEVRPGPLAFESVGFAYPGQSARALDDVSVAVAPGQTLGVVGSGFLPGLSAAAMVAEIAWHLKAKRPRGTVGKPARRRLVRVELDVGGVDLVALAHRAGTLEQVLELAHIAREGIALQRMQRGGRQSARRPALTRSQASEDVLGERGNVLTALAQRRHAQGDDVDAEEEVLAEAPFRDQSPEILMRR